MAARTLFTAGRRTGVLGDTWNDRMKNILVSIIAQTPPAEGVPLGKMISSLLKAFWPDSKTNIWGLIKGQVEGLVDKNTFESEFQEINPEIRALQKTMEMYVEAKIGEKASLMSVMIQACNELFYKLTESKNSVQLIPLVITHSAEHLLILKERLLYGKEIYNEDNTAFWRKDLEKQISLYKDYMADIHSKWVKWRHLFTYQCEVTRKKIISLQNGKLLQIMLPIFYLNNFIPGKEDNPSVIPQSMSIASFGPISPHIEGRTERPVIFTPGDDNTRGGEVTKINVREAHVIDGIQIFYTTHSGEFIGNSQGGYLHEIPLNNRRVKSVQLCEDLNNIVEITIKFSNGNSTGPLGDRTKRKIRSVNTGDIDTYSLYNIRAAGYGPIYGLFQIELDYKAYPCRPSQLENRARYFVDLD